MTILLTRKNNILFIFWDARSGHKRKISSCRTWNVALLYFKFNFGFVGDFYCPILVLKLFFLQQRRRKKYFKQITVFKKYIASRKNKKKIHRSPSLFSIFCVKIFYIFTCITNLVGIFYIL